MLVDDCTVHHGDDVTRCFGLTRCRREALNGLGATRHSPAMMPGKFCCDKFSSSVDCVFEEYCGLFMRRARTVNWYRAMLRDGSHVSRLADFDRAVVDSTCGVFLRVGRLNRGRWPSRGRIRAASNLNSYCQRQDSVGGMRLNIRHCHSRARSWCIYNTDTTLNV